MSNDARAHALDNLRAVMMWLGVVLHVAALHRPQAAGLGWQDTQVTPAADLVVALIHAFRMPVFFIVAGFFVGLLGQRLGTWGMLRHRTARIGLPLLVLGPPILASLVVLCTLHAQPPGQWPTLGFDLSKVPPTASGSHVQTGHLWFVYQLMGLVVLAALLQGALAHTPAAWRGRAAQRLQAWVTHPLACVVLALPLAVAGRHHKGGVLEASGELLPPLGEWVFFGLFFAYGALLFRQRTPMLETLQRRVLPHAAAGVFFFALAAGLFAFSAHAPGQLPYERVFSGWAYNACAWLWAWALIGGFLRWLPRQNAVLAFVAASSYWMYLIHLPIVGLTSLVIREWPQGAALKMVLNIVVTSAACLATYQWLVRPTVLGTLLNGKRRPVPGLALGATH
ncbi:MAG: acyltransferase family protein [Rubrivivax sp.]|nr:acyltransferase family protein [Rubrivivax sp.]